MNLSQGYLADPLYFNFRVSTISIHLIKFSLSFIKFITWWDICFDSFQLIYFYFFVAEILTNWIGNWPMQTEAYFDCRIFIIFITCGTQVLKWGLVPPPHLLKTPLNFFAKLVLPLIFKWFFTLNFIKKLVYSVNKNSIQG